MLVEILLLLLTSFLGVYFYITKNYGYFKAKGLAEAPGSFPFGSEHMWKLMTRKISAISMFDEMIKQFPEDNIFGVYAFGMRDLVVKDLELAKRILIKDADHFMDRPAIDTEGATKESDKIFALFLTNLKGEQWKKVPISIS
jgi:cytochrome P450 family 9